MAPPDTLGECLRQPGYVEQPQLEVRCERLVANVLVGLLHVAAGSAQPLHDYLHPHDSSIIRDYRLWKEGLHTDAGGTETDC